MTLDSISLVIDDRMEVDDRGDGENDSTVVVAVEATFLEGDDEKVKGKTS